MSWETRCVSRLREWLPRSLSAAVLLTVGIEREDGCRVGVLSRAGFDRWLHCGGGVDSLAMVSLQDYSVEFPDCGWGMTNHLFSRCHVVQIVSKTLDHEADGCLLVFDCRIFHINHFCT